MCLSTLALLGVTVWMIADEYRRPWRRYQREYRRLFELAPDGAPVRGVPAQCGLPSRKEGNVQSDAQSKWHWVPAIEQIWLPKLTLDYHFRQVARFDRCTTCHQGIAEPDRGFPQPFRPHPRQDLYLASRSPHPVDEFGCTICHDGQGSGTSFRWSAHTPDTPEDAARWRREHQWQPDPHWQWPMLPRRFVESRCLRCHHEVTDLQPSGRYPDPPAPKLLAGYHLIRQNGCFGCHEIHGYDAAGRRVGPDMRLEPHGAADGDGPPGTMRKVGPSLRDVAQKLTAAMIVDRTADPRRFLPTTRMPRLFGLHAHLSGTALEEAGRFEPVELHAIAAYLLAASEPVQPLPPPQGFTEDPLPARGRKAFQMHGCMACHKHEAFPEGQSTVGPDLSQLGAKYMTDSGRDWLADFLRDPAHRAPRTLMPYVPLEPADSERSPSPAEAEEAAPVDPVADLMAFLLDVPPYSPAEAGYHPEDLDELILAHLTRAMPRAEAERLLRASPTQWQGLVAVDKLSHLAPERRQATATGGSRVDDSRAKRAPGVPGPSPTTEDKLRYLGRRTIAKRGCYACHDIPGFEDAPPIGPALTDWGRKRESLLAFEHVQRYVAEAAADEGETPDPFYLDAIRRRRREGFLWQKLREPRSFDYMKAPEKPFSEWLTMGQFDLTDEQRETIVTFVLGLTADPPAEQYVHQPDRSRRAIVEGRQVLDRFACAECHTLGMEQWTIAYDPAQFDPPPQQDGFDWLLPHFSQAEIEASLEVDARGLAHATLTGMPRLDDEGRLVVVDDDQDAEGRERLLHAFSLWEPTVLAGEVAAVGGADVLVWSDQIVRKRPPWGGDLARLLYPAALAEARAAGAHPIGPEAWGWLPPPLVHCGEAVRSDWLSEYLLRPYAIRTASTMRMPRYNLSAEETEKLVEFFAAHSGARLRYAGTPSLRRLPGEPLTPELQDRFAEAMRMLLDEQTYCARCHQLGDYRPGDAVRSTLAPDLTHVAPRLRAEFLHRWLAGPSSVLPYTPMPANFPPSGRSLDPIRFPGDSIEQLQSMTELLLNYNWYLRQRRPVREFMK